MGEKSGWYFVELSPALSEALNPGVRKSFRVKGTLDRVPIAGMALVPVGGGAFILPLKGALRKAIGKGEGAEISLRLQPDDAPFVPHPELMECLADEPAALAAFRSLPLSHQRYYSRWVGEAKGAATRAGRIERTVAALLGQKSFGEMLRDGKDA